MTKCRYDMLIDLKEAQEEGRQQKEKLSLDTQDAQITQSRENLPLNRSDAATYSDLQRLVCVDFIDLIIR